MIASPTNRWLKSLLLSTSLSLTGCGSDVLTALQTNTEEFTQATAAKVDILWVVDNSESMAEEQAGLGESFDSFMETLIASGVDFHIGVISMDVADGGVLHSTASTPKFIELGTTDPKAAFLANVKVGTSGSRREKGFEAAALALGKGAGWSPTMPDPVAVPNEGFLRRGLCTAAGTCEGTAQSCTTNAECSPAALFVTFVSDEDDKSFGPVKYYWRLFESYYGAGNEALVKLSAIVGPTGEPGGCFREGRGAAEAGTRYSDLVMQAAGSNTADGIVTSICDDFASALTSLSITAAGLSAKFTLSKTPNKNASIDCGSVGKHPFCVTVNGTAMAPDSTSARTGWTYNEDENAIIFGVNGLPPPRAKITVKYQMVRGQ